jgi:hypothetical protein
VNTKANNVMVLLLELHARPRTQLDMTYLSDGVDVNIVFCAGRMRDEGFHQELSQNTLNSFHLLELSRLGLNPCACFGPGLIQSQQSTLASSFDQLIWFCNELGARLQEPRVCGLGLIENRCDCGIFGEMKGSEFRGRVMLRRGWERCRLDHWSSGKVIVEDGLAISFENGFCSHGDVRRIVVKSIP